MSSHCTRSGVYGSVQDQGNALIAKDHCSRVSKLCDGSPSYNLHLLDGSSCHFLPQSGACLVRSFYPLVRISNGRTILHFEFGSYYFRQLFV
ncbi:uncharacterized protein [Physcomitrium patens]|uniref:uncharacterized protein isoform X3 n=1 Tax=Physcomitrium patens TaxID=3218 RepID=UPI003CCE10EA